MWLQTARQRHPHCLKEKQDCYSWNEKTWKQFHLLIKCPPVTFWIKISRVERRGEARYRAHTKAVASGREKRRKRPLLPSGGVRGVGKEVRDGGIETWFGEKRACSKAPGWGSHIRISPSSHLLTSGSLHLHCLWLVSRLSLSLPSHLLRNLSLS